MSALFLYFKKVYLAIYMARAEEKNIKNLLIKRELGKEYRSNYSLKMEK